MRCMHAQLCLTLCHPMDCNPPGSSVMGFSRQERWSGLPCPSLGDLPDPGTEPESSASPAPQADSLPTEPPGKSQMRWLNRNLFSHSSLEDRRLRSRCQQGHDFLEASREEYSLATSSFQGVAGNTWLVDASLQFLFPSAYAILLSVCLSVFM